MIHEFGDWSASRSFTNNLSDLADSVLAIDASFYLDRFFNSRPGGPIEPLLAATGGLPFSLSRRFKDELDILRAHNIKPVFVFNGLQLGKPHDPFAQANQVSVKADKAWDTYTQSDAPTAVEEFGLSGYATPDRYTASFQTTLLDFGVEFQVAPYSALGQLAYLAKRASEYIDAIAGPSDLLLYDVDRVITSINFEQQEFTFIKRQHCIEELGNLSPDMFVDACMLSGCSLLPTLPSLAAPNPRVRSPKVRAVVDLMRSNNHTGYAVCNSFQDDPTVKRTNYVDRYKRGRLSVKHPVILTINGDVEPSERDSLPNDLHEVIGQRLPAELYYYLSVAAVSPVLLNKLALRHIYEACPVDGGESEPYRQLVSSGLNPIRVRTLQLIAKSLFRSYIHTKVSLTCWFTSDRDTELSLVEEADDVQATVDRWLVSQSVLDESSKLKDTPTTLRTAVSALSDAGFAAKTTTHEKNLRLQSTEELKSNTLWRFLQVREYLNADHALSSWGKVLHAVLSELPEDQSSQDAALLAVELLRQDLLRSDAMFPSLTGQPQNGKESDKKLCMLLSRVACLGSISHEEGFTGPLSRHLLAFGSVVDALRGALRELFEASLASLLLSGNVKRERDDLSSVGLGLPMLSAINIGLGLIIKHYFDDVMATDDSSSPASKAKALESGKVTLFPRSLDYEGDLKRGFKLWDAVYSGVRVGIAEKVIKTDERWDLTNAWVQAHR